MKEKIDKYIKFLEILLSYRVQWMSYSKNHHTYDIALERIVVNAEILYINNLINYYKNKI
jgi:hypothetical protein